MLSQSKTVTAAFHLNIQVAKHELNVCNFVQPYLFCGKTGQIAHVLSPSRGIAQKIMLAGHNAEATCSLRMEFGAKTLRSSFLSLVYSTAEYCAPVWCRTSHTRLINSLLNDALRIVTGCLHPTTDHQPYFQASSQLSFAEKKRHSATLDLTIQKIPSWT